MKLEHFFYNESFKWTHHQSIPLLGKYLNNLDILVEQIHLQKENVWIDDGFYDVELIPNTSIVDWVFSAEESDEMQDERSLLSKTLQRSQSTIMSQHNYQDVNERIDNLSPIPDTTLLCLNKIKANPLYLHSVEDLREARKFYLQSTTDEFIFIERAKMCFENLFFHDNVSTSLKTLSASLKDYTEEIIIHLEALNSEAPKIFKEFHQQGDQFMLEKLSVPASPSRKPTTVKNDLTFTFKTTDNRDIAVACGPHTKLNGQMRKGSTEYLQDRIYFSWGNKEVASGKILIAHIGEHK